MSKEVFEHTRLLLERRLREITDRADRYFEEDVRDR
jgi:hypothetical protein